VRDASVPTRLRPGGAAIARYYDRNTRRFLLVGGARDTYAIHRQLWGEGVTNARDAADYVHGLIEDRARAAGLGPDPTILDLGCGVGGTLFRLGLAFPRSRLHGVTISPRQVRVANRIANRKRLGDRFRIHLDDFESARLDLRAGLVVAIESFAHAAAADRFMACVAHHLEPGGRLVLADDFLAAPERELDARAREHVVDFRAGWRVPGVSTLDACVRAAGTAGLELTSADDLTHLTRQGRPRDRAIALVSPWLRRSGFASTPFFGNMIGGNALQIGLREGFLKYRFIVFRRKLHDLPLIR
jgi:cyclopropane fatty-acyl-phospholipid synthase-like methyltransferase